MVIKAPKRATQDRKAKGRATDAAGIAELILKKLRAHLEEAVTAGIQESGKARDAHALGRLMQEKGTARLQVEGGRVLLALGIEGILDTAEEGAPAKALDLPAILTDKRLYASECRQVAACLRSAAKQLENLADEKIAAGWGIRPIH